MSISNMEDAGDAAGLPVSATDRAILDAARACVAEFGVRRTTLAEVARRAGVSRPTVYRRWPDTRALIGELLTQEMRAATASTATSGLTARERLVTTLTSGLMVLRDNPLFAKIFRTDADLLVTYIVSRIGRSQHELLVSFRTQIAEGQADGSIRAGNPAELAAMVLLIAQSAVQSARMIAPLLSGPRLATELGEAIDRYLQP